MASTPYDQDVESGGSFLEAFMGIRKCPPRPDKPSTNSIKHPMYKDLDGRYWPIVIRQLELGSLFAEDEAKWDEQVDGELF